jgi:hypothetical protein
MFHFTRRANLWVPSDDGAEAWWDTTLPGGVVTGPGGGAVPGAWLLRDWSGHHHHATQATAANQGDMALTGPGGAPSIHIDNTNDGWDIAGNLGAGNDHSFIAGCNLDSVPAAPNADTTLFNRTAAAAVYALIGGATSALGLFSGGAAEMSDVVGQTGVHSYSWILNGTAGTAMCYRDTTPCSAPIAYTASPIGASGKIGQTVGYFPLDGAMFRAAYWPSVVSAAILSRAQAWAVRDNL